MTKTNAMRLLDAAGIAYRTAEYEYDESDLSGKHAAEQLGMPAEQVFKTLVTRGDKTGLLVFCIPVLDELDLLSTRDTDPFLPLTHQEKDTLRQVVPYWRTRSVRALSLIHI